MNFKARLKFYADIPSGEMNKYFCWDIPSILQAEDRLMHFIEKGYQIRAAWFENINTDTGEVVENSRFCIDTVIDKIISR